MTTNKYAGICTKCGEMVAPGDGELYREFDNYEDEVIWKVRHSDSEVCASVELARKNTADCNRAIDAVFAYIKEFGDKTNSLIYGEQIVIDQRRGYNQIGWIATVDDNNTIFLTSRLTADGYDMSETYTLEDCGDDGYDNSNNDIVSALTSLANKTMIDVQPYQF